MIHWAYNIGYIVTIALLCDVFYTQGIKEHDKEVRKAMSMCQAAKYEEAYVAFAYDGVRCFKESTQWPHRAKGYSLVYNEDKEK